MASVSDDFNRANETSPDLQSPWVSVEGLIVLASNVVKGDGFNIRNAYRRGGAGLTNDYEVQVVIADGPNASGERYLGPCARMSSVAVTYYAFHSDNVQSKIIMVVAGTPTDLITGGAPFVVTDLPSLRVVGNALTGLIGGVEELTITDSTIASGEPGILIHSSHTPALYDFFAQDVGGSSPTVIDTATIAAICGGITGTATIVVTT